VASVGELADEQLRATIFQQIPRPILTQALEHGNLLRPQDDVYYRELHDRYRSVRSFLPAIAKHIRFGANPAGLPVVAAIEWLRNNERANSATRDAPRDVITKGWQHHVLQDDGELDYRAHMFCVLDQLRSALRCRDVFVSPSWRYADPRTGLVTGHEWETLRPFICRTLELPPDPQPALAALTQELDQPSAP
jgi:hypothetical protein